MRYHHPRVLWIGDALPKGLCDVQTVDSDTET